VGTHPKNSPLKQLKTHFKAKREKVWERRSYAFPPHYIPENKLFLSYPNVVTYCVISQVNTVQLYLQAQ